jgi:hypothetical protein
MPELEIRYKAQGPTLERYHLSRTPVQCIMGPLGSGKTSATIHKIFGLICAQRAVDGVRRSRILVTRNTYPDLTDTTIRDWLEIVSEELGQFSRGHPPEHRLDFDLEDGTRVLSEVVFIALDRPDHVRKLRGFQATFAWMNEIKEQPKAIFDGLDGRIGRFPRQVDGGASWAGILGDYNACDTDHWLYELEQQWRAGELPDYEFFIQPGGVIKVDGKWIVNPDRENQAGLPPGYYERLLQGKSEDYIRVELGNEYGFIMDGKPVHPDYVDSVHSWPEPLDPVKGVPIVVGMDFGLTPAATFLQLLPIGRWIAFDELVATDMGAERFAEQLKYKIAEYPGFMWTFRGDPAGDSRAGTDERTVFQVLAANGIQAVPASTNDVGLRRSALQRPLRRLIAGRPGIVFGPKCKVLRKALAGGFCYKRIQVAGAERFRDVPDKNEFSHVAEACEYALIDGGEKATISPTAAALGASGPITVKQSWSPFD